MRIMSSPSTPRADKADSPPAIVELGKKDSDNSNATSSSSKRKPSPSSVPSQADCSANDDEPIPDRATIAASLKVPSALRLNKPNKEHIEESIETLVRIQEGRIQEGGMSAPKDRASSPDSDTSSLSDAPSSLDSDDDDTEMRDAGNTDTEELSFDEKISIAVAQARNTKDQSKCTPKKHRITPPVSGPEKKKPRLAPKRDRSAEAALEVQKLPYQSIISLNMPPRPGVVPGQPIPEPDSANLPFGDTEDYNNSMIIHYMDEVEMTYTKAAEVYSARFPRDAVTDEAVRKRHIRSLLRLKKKFGVRDPDTIPRPSKAVIRRGTPRAKKVSLITPVSSTPSATPAPVSPNDAAASTPSTPVTVAPKRKLLPRVFEKALIVTWHDDAKMSWKDIQNKLEDEYKWSLGQGTIEKYYYVTLERVYGKGGKKEKNVEAREEQMEEGEGKREDGDFGGFVERLVERRMSF